MKTAIATETIQALAIELALAESARSDAAAAAVKSATNYWEGKLYGIKTACRALIGCWPAVYVVRSLGYVVVDFEPASMCSDGVEFHVDVNTFEFLAL